MYCKVVWLGLNCIIAAKTEVHRVRGAELNCMQVNRYRCIQHRDTKLTLCSFFINTKKSRADQESQVTHKIK